MNTDEGCFGGIFRWINLQLRKCRCECDCNKFINTRAFIGEFNCDVSPKLSTDIKKTIQLQPIDMDNISDDYIDNDIYVIDDVVDNIVDDIIDNVVDIADNNIASNIVVVADNIVDDVIDNNIHNVINNVIDDVNKKNKISKNKELDQEYEIVEELTDDQNFDLDFEIIDC